MSLEEFFDIIQKYVKEFDRPSAIRAYRAYCQKGTIFDSISVEECVHRLLPKDDEVSVSSILCTYGTSGPYEISQAIRWLQAQKYIVTDTLVGPCTTSDHADQLGRFLANAIPVESEFYRYCSTCSIEANRALFEAFRRKFGQSFLKTRFHPFSNDKFFFMDPEVTLSNLFEKWIAETYAHEASTIEGFLSVKESADILGIAPDKLLSWLWSHRESWISSSGRALIEETVVLEWCTQWKSVYSITSILKSRLDAILAKFRNETKISIMAHITESSPKWLLPNGTLPQQSDSVLYTADLASANNTIDTILNSLYVYPLSMLKDITGLSIKVLKFKIDNGIIDAVEDEDKNIYISRNEYDRIDSINRHFISLDETVAKVLDRIDSNFDLSKQSDRQSLTDFCDEHNWWNIAHVDCDDQPLDGKRMEIAILREDSHLLETHLSLWLKCHRQSSNSCFTILTDHYATQFPQTVKKLLEFEKNEHKVDHALIDMTHLLLGTLKCEISKMSTTAIENELINSISEEATAVAFNTLGDFLFSSGYTNRRYMAPKYESEIDTTAYPFAAFSTMLHHIADKDTILRDDLIGKALSAKKYADLWMYIALHFYACWRSTDYIKMHAPSLPCSASEMLRRIRDDKLSANEAISIAKFFIRINELALDTPNKTKGTSGVPKLYFYCPTSHMEAFGRIIAIAAAHYELSPQAESFIVPTTNIFLIQQFFGDDFVEACGRKNFSGRRANKALLQSVEYAGRQHEQLQPMVAYHLDSIMRSHKLSYGRPSDTTATYLKDATFTGLTPEFVAYQMFERGVCSFVVDVMLKKCYCTQYVKLTVSQQTETITNLGLTPANAASLLDCIHLVEDQACETVASVCQDTMTMEKALQAIAMGHGIGKDPTTYCLLKSIGKGCAYKDRASCLGCKFCISTTGLFFQLVMNHQTLLLAASKASGLEKSRLEHLCRTTTYPAVAEILSHLRRDDVDCEIQIYKKLIEEVNNHGITDGSP